MLYTFIDNCIFVCCSVMNRIVYIGKIVTTRKYVISLLTFSQNGIT